MLRECIFITELSRERAILPRQQLWLSTRVSTNNTEVKHTQLEINTLCLQGRVAPALWTTEKSEKPWPLLPWKPKRKFARSERNIIYFII